jgi:sec-independent protein translocase protein TatB
VFNVGGLELVAIGLVALVVLGPDKLPGAVRQAGSVLGQLRRLSDGFRLDLTAALDDDHVEPAVTDVPTD